LETKNAVDDGNLNCSTGSEYNATRAIRDRT
jgi:hypothetical protein